MDNFSFRVNIGLNAIAQFCGNFNNKLPQGLGTGSLYVNNFDSPLEITDQYLSLDRYRKWNLNQLVFDEDYTNYKDILIWTRHESMR